MERREAWRGSIIDFTPEAETGSSKTCIVTFVPSGMFNGLLFKFDNIPLHDGWGCG